MQSAMTISLSVVVPCFNEEEVLAETIRRLEAALGALGISYEVLFVDDGSRDRTLVMLRELQTTRSWMRVIGLSRNYGHQLAVSAGIDHAAGEAVVLIDADLQDPPELIRDMLAKWREGYQVVYGRRQVRRGEGWFKLATASLFYRLLNRLSEVPIPLDTGDFRLMDRRVVEALKSMPERDRFIRGMVAWVGFNQYALTYERVARFAGVSKYPLRKMLAFAIDGILSFSIKPLRFATGAGVAIAFVAFAGVMYALIMRLFTDNWVSGWTLLFIAVAFLGGVQLVCLGIIGEYVGRIYRENKRRPLYLVNDAIGFPVPSAVSALAHPATDRFVRPASAPIIASVSTHE